MDAGPDGPTGTAGPTEDEVARLAEERARLQAEVDNLRAQVNDVRTRRAGRPRRIATAALVVATSLVFTVAVTGVWARRNVLDTNRWVGTVGPVVEDPAVQAALGSWITNELMVVIDPEDVFENALPERGQVLAAPLSNAVRGFVNNAVDRFLASDAFERLWVEVNRIAHERAVAVLEGDTGDGLQIEDGQVVLNLVPALNQVLAEIGEASPEIFGRTVDLPTITVDEVSADAIDKLEAALGRDIPDNFGQFTVFEASRLRQVQEAVDLFNRLVVVTVVAAVALAALSLWLAPRRRRTLIQLMVGIALGVVVVRRLGLLLADDIVDFVEPENRDAVKVAVDAFIATLMDATAWILAIAALVAAVALLSGPYRWARAVRRRSASSARAIAAAVGAASGSDDEPVATWGTTHKAALQAGGIVVAIIVLLVVDLSWLGLLLLALAVGAYELIVWRIAQRQAPLGEAQEGGAVVEPR